jgi:hypothetical protein
VTSTTEARSPLWAWLYDNYDTGTAFITDDLRGSQRAIAEDLPYDVAKRIAIAHNEVVARLASDSTPEQEPSE